MKITKLSILVIGTLLMLSGFAGQSVAGVDINVGINVPPPPAYVVQAPPDVVLVPGTYVYVVPDIPVRILFFDGMWWRSIKGRWFSSASYNGPWGFVSRERVPGAIISLPRNYYRMALAGPRIHYADLHANWQRWSRERHWDKPNMKPGERREMQRKEERRDEREKHEEHRGD